MERQLLDHRGEPVRKSELKQEDAAPRVSGIRQAWSGRSVAAGLTPEKLARILRAAADGDADSYLHLAEEMEEREPHYASVLGTRKRAVLGVEPSVSAAGDSAQDIKIAEEVRELVEAPIFEDLCADLLDGLGKGFSAVEIMWDRRPDRWRPRAYEHRHPTWFRFDRDTGRELLLIDEDAIMGRRLPAFKYAVHYPKLKTGLPIRGGLARLAAWSYLFKNYGVKDWMAFAETFGLPIRLGKYPASATQEDVDKLFQAVANIGTDAAAAVPESMMIEFIDAAKSQGGESLFERLADWTDRQVSKAVIGQTMTTDEGGRGGRAQASVHDEVRGDITKYDARQLAKTLNRDLIQPYVDINFGRQERYPHLDFPIEETEELKVWFSAVKDFVDRGGRVRQSQVRERLKLDTPDDDDELMVPASTRETPQPEETADAANRSGVAVNRSEAPADEIDDLADESAGEWREVIDPMTDPVIAAIEAADSYEDAIARLDELGGATDIAPLAKRLAELTFKARGDGDARD